MIIQKKKNLDTMRKPFINDFFIIQTTFCNETINLADLLIFTMQVQFRGELSSTVSILQKNIISFKGASYGDKICHSTCGIHLHLHVQAKQEARLCLITL